MTYKCKPEYVSGNWYGVINGKSFKSSLYFLAISCRLATNVSKRVNCVTPNAACNSVMR